MRPWIKLNAETPATLAETTEAPELLTALVRKMASQLTLSTGRQSLRTYTGVFEAADAVTWLMVYCRQQNMSPGIWVLSPVSQTPSFFAKFRRKEQSPRHSRSLSAGNWSELHVSPPTPPPTVISTVISVPSVPENHVQTDEPPHPRADEPFSPTSFLFSKLKDRTPSPEETARNASVTPPATHQPSFFSKLKNAVNPNRRPSIDRVRSSPDKFSCPSPGGLAVPSVHSPSVSPKVHSPLSRLPSKSSRAVPSPQTTGKGRGETFTFEQARHSESKEDGHHGHAKKPSDEKAEKMERSSGSDKKLGIEDKRKRSVCSNDGRASHSKKTPSDEKKKGEEKSDPHNKQSSGEDKKNDDKKKSDDDERSSGQRRNGQKKEEHDDIIDRAMCTRVWRCACELGLIQSVQGKKFTDSHGLFRFNLPQEETSVERSDGELRSSLSERRDGSFLSERRDGSGSGGSFSGFTASTDPTPTTTFETIPENSKSASIGSYYQSSLEPVGGPIDQETKDGYGRVSTPGLSGPTTPIYETKDALPPAELFDYSQIRDFAWPLIAEAYSPFARIGRGGFGEVFSACCATPLGPRLVAVKVMDLEKLDLALPWLEQESKVMSQLRHPNLTQVFCSFVSGTSVWLVMPLARGGSCTQIMEANGLRGFPSLDIISFIMFHVVSGLSYLHAHGLLHRDIKADNILISHLGEVQLADFGCAGAVEEKGASLLKLPAGTRDFMSPEMVHGCGYDERTDIWSLGITAMELFMGSTPSNLREAEEAMDPPVVEVGRRSWSRSRSSRSPSSRSSEHLCVLDGQAARTGSLRLDMHTHFRDFVDMCLSRSPNDRPSARSLLEHPFLQAQHRGRARLVQLVKRVRPVTALTLQDFVPAMQLVPFIGEKPKPGRRALSLPSLPRKTSGGRHMSFDHTVAKRSKDDFLEFL